jgi:hypothetical protein
MLGAAQYLGKSREWLRKLHLRGEGPHRARDGTYSYDDLTLSQKVTPTSKSAARTPHFAPSPRCPVATVVVEAHGAKGLNLRPRPITVPERADLGSEANMRLLCR